MMTIPVIEVRFFVFVAQSESTKAMILELLVPRVSVMV